MLGRKGLIVVLLSTAGVAHAGDKPIYQPAPAWVEPAPEPDVAKLTAADPATVIMDRQARIEKGLVWDYTDQATRAVSPQTLTQMGQITLTWQPDAGDLIVHRAEIIRGTEHIDLVAQGQRFEVLHREEQLEQAALTGQLTATMSVPGLRVGDVLRLVYSVTTRDKALQGGAQEMLPLFAMPMRAGFARSRLSWPHGEPVKWRVLAEAPTPAVTKRGGYDQIELKLPLAKQPELPADAPVRYQKLGLIEASTFADWAAISRTMAPLYTTEGAIAPGSPLAAEVAKIAAASKLPMERAAAALRLVQDEVRYLYRGMDGGNYIPQSPSETWTRRYGDCKAKTLLLLAVLHALSIEAEPVLASSSLGDLVPTRLPTPGAFDHVLVRATVDGATLWLDGTGSGTRIADLRDVPPFRNVLPLRAAGTGLMALAPTAPAQPMIEIDVVQDQRAGLGLPTPFTVVMKLHGAPAEQVSVASGQMDKDQLNQMATGMVRPVMGEALPGEPKIAYDADRAIATITVSGVTSTPWRRDGGRYRLEADKSLSGLSFNPDRSRASWKDIAVAGGPPMTVEYRTRVLLPDGGKGFVLEGLRTIPALAPGQAIQREASLVGEELKIADRITNTGADIPAAELPAARTRTAQVSSQALKLMAPVDMPRRVAQVAAARRSGTLTALTNAYRDGIAADPDSALPYVNRARFHAGIYDWKAALADWDKAIELEPTADNYLARGSVRMAMRDDDGALADAKEALALEPSNAQALGSVAEYQSRHGKLDDALAMLAEQAAQGGDDEKRIYVSAQADLLVKAGRARDGLALLDPLVVAKPADADLLNSRCWLKGTGNIELESALTDCTKSIELSEQPTAALDSRGLVYFRMGKMAEALADFDAALAIYPENLSSRFMRGVVRKRMGERDGDADIGEARIAAPRLEEDYARWGIRP